MNIFNMSALNLIQQYSSDDEEDDNKEVALDQKPGKTKRILPLPDSIMKWQGITIHEEVIDDPSQHEGRIRSFKHERGNWSTIVYVDYHASDELKSWMQLAAETINIGNIKTFDEYHISLSRTVILKFHWIDSFVDALKQIVVKFENFLVELSNLKVYCNEEKTRTFLGIEVRANDETMEQLTKAVDTLLSEYNLPAFYEAPSYHISFLWCIGDRRTTIEQFLPSLISSFEDFLISHLDQHYFTVDNIKCKTGNKLYNFSLKK